LKLQTDHSKTRELAAGLWTFDIKPKDEGLVLKRRSPYGSSQTEQISRREAIRTKLRSNQERLGSGKRRGAARDRSRIAARNFRAWSPDSPRISKVQKKWRKMLSSLRADLLRKLDRPKRIRQRGQPHTKTNATERFFMRVTSKEAAQL